MSRGLMQGLRVTFVAGTLGQGGAERQLFYMLHALKQSGADTRVLCLTEHEYWEERIRAIGVDVTYAGARSSRVARLVRIVAALRAHPPHVVQSQHFYTNLYAALAARTLRLPEIGAIRNDTVSEVRANGRMLGTWSLTLPRTVAANSRLGMSNAESLGVASTRLRFLPNVVDTDQFAPSTETGAVAGSALRVIAVGRLTEQKRMDRFLQVIARLRSEVGESAIHATIAGSGPLRSQLQSQADALSLRAPVLEFAGAVSDMRALYRQADVLVLTSQWEGTPNVVLEAMASGLAVVSTPVGGVPEIIRHGDTGLLVDGSDDRSVVDGCCKAIHALLSDRRERSAIGARARAFVHEHHSVRALPRILSTLYESVLS